MLELLARSLGLAVLTALLTGTPLALGQASLDVADLDGTNGFRLNGINVNDFSGSKVSSAGDMNNDSFDDILIGAPDADPNGSSSGESYVVFGAAGGFGPTIELSTLNGTNGFVINGIDPGDRSGIAVSEIGDFNGDGFGDIVLGAREAQQGGVTLVGEAYVVFGTAGGFPAALELSALNGTNGFALLGIDFGDRTGFDVSSAGDFNGDGLNNVLIAAPFASPNGLLSGECYVVFGTMVSPGASFDLATLNGSNGFVLRGIDPDDQAGRSAACAGDVNNDGFDDLIIGAPEADANGSQTGESYVVFGTNVNPGPALELSSLNGVNGFQINGVAAFDECGDSVSAAGDFNGDGFGDVLIGAAEADGNGLDDAGEAYVVFGAAGGFANSLELSALNGTNGLRIPGVEECDTVGDSVSGAGDVNGDNLSDILITSDAGAARQCLVIFGTNAAVPTFFDTSTLDGTNGFVINGEDPFDQFGEEVSGAGDVNGDGLDDIAIGADGADPNGSSSGTTYIIFGFQPPLQFTYSAPGQSVGYDPDDAIPVSFVQSLLVEEAAANPGFPNGIQGVQARITYDPTRLVVLAVDPGADLSSLNGGAGPDFFQPEICTDFVSVGVVVSLMATDSLLAGIPREFGALELQTNAASLLGNLTGESTLLVWQDGTNCPATLPATNVVVVAGESHPVTTFDGQIDLVPEEFFVRGDCNVDSLIDIGDPIFLVNHLFLPGSPSPQCDDSCDANDDGGLDIGDVIYELGAIFSGGPVPPPPFSTCGPDPTADPLVCEGYPGC